MRAGRVVGTTSLELVKEIRMCRALVDVDQELEANVCDAELRRGIIAFALLGRLFQSTEHICGV